MTTHDDSELQNRQRLGFLIRAVFLLFDGSGSMEQPERASGQPKHAAVAQMVQDLIDELDNSAFANTYLFIYAYDAGVTDNGNYRPRITELLADYDVQSGPYKGNSNPKLWDPLVSHGGGTPIGAALDYCFQQATAWVERTDGQEQRRAVIYLLSDGENNIGDDGRSVTGQIEEFKETMMYPNNQLPVAVLDHLAFVEGTVAAPPALRAEIALVNQRIEQTGLSLVHAFNAPLFTGERRFPSPEYGREWRFMPIDEDPLYNRPEGFPFPDEILRELERMERAFIDVDTFYVAHEVELLPEGRAEPTTLALLQPPPPMRVVEQSSQMGNLAQQVQRVASLPFLGALAGLTAMVAVPAGLASLALLDPILFAVVAEPDQPFGPGTVGAWFYVGHWVYA